MLIVALMEHYLETMFRVELLRETTTRPLIHTLVLIHLLAQKQYILVEQQQDTQMAMVHP